MRLLFTKPNVARTLTVARFNYTGAPQYFTVPPSTYQLRVKLWSGGGGSHPSYNTAFKGGSSAFVSGTLQVQPSEQLTIYVGQAGGNGIAAGDAGGGGGATALLRGSTVLAIAGAGSGSLWNSDYGNCGRLQDQTQVVTSVNGQDGVTWGGSYPAAGGWGYGTGGRGGGSGIVGGPGGGAGAQGGIGGRGGLGGGSPKGYGGTSSWDELLLNPVCEAGQPNLPGGSSDYYKDPLIGNYNQNGQLVILYKSM